MYELADALTRLANAIRILPQGKYPGKDGLSPDEVIRSGGRNRHCHRIAVQVAALVLE